jgi:hypothetical protein
MERTMVEIDQRVVNGSAEVLKWTCAVCEALLQGMCHVVYLVLLVAFSNDC